MDCTVGRDREDSAFPATELRQHMATQHMAQSRVAGARPPCRLWRVSRPGFLSGARMCALVAGRRILNTQDVGLGSADIELDARLH
jgi:hypothetical protein